MSELIAAICSPPIPTPSAGVLRSCSSRSSSWAVTIISGGRSRSTSPSVASATAGLDVRRAAAIALVENRNLEDGKSGVKGKSVSVRVDLGGRRILKKKQNQEQ